MLVPVHHGVVGDYDVVDYTRRSADSAPATGGLCYVLLGGRAVSAGELWLVDHLAVSCTSTSQTIARVFASPDETVPTANRYRRDGTRSGNEDYNDRSSPIQIGPSEQLLVAWYGADDGSVGTAYAQWRVLRQRG